MTTTRRTFLLGLLGAGALPLSGCITRYIFSPDTYTEQVSSALISQDGKNIIVATDDYHYIFASDPAIIRVLKSRAHKAVTANFTGFKVGANGETEGSVVLSLPGDDPALAQEAQKIGFTQGESKDYTEIIHMQGTRYRASDVKFSDSYALNKTYTIEVTAEKSGAKKGAMYLLSPITVAADGALILVGVPLVALTMTIECGRRPNCFK